MPTEITLGPSRLHHEQYILAAKNGDGQGYTLGIRGETIRNESKLFFLDVTYTDLVAIREGITKLIEELG